MSDFSKRYIYERQARYAETTPNGGKSYGWRKVGHDEVLITVEVDIEAIAVALGRRAWLKNKSGRAKYLHGAVVVSANGPKHTKDPAFKATQVVNGRTVSMRGKAPLIARLNEIENARGRASEEDLERTYGWRIAALSEDEAKELHL